MIYGEVIDTFPYEQTFSYGLPPGWTNEGNSGWDFDGIDAHTEFYCWGDYCDGTDFAILTTCEILLPVDHYIEFVWQIDAYVMCEYQTDAYAEGNIYFEISTDGGSNWTSLTFIQSQEYCDESRDQTNDKSREYEHVFIDLTGYEGSIYVRWIYDGWAYAMNNWEQGTTSEAFVEAHLDDIKIKKLDTPQVDISYSNDEIALNWDPVDFAGSYKIYSSTDPYLDFGSWTFVEETANTQWSTTNLIDKIYYRVIAIS